MQRWISLCLFVLGAALAAPAASAAPLDDRFDAAGFGQAELRLIQAALAAEGGFDGPADGRWTTASQDALAAWSHREFGTGPANLQAAALMIDFVGLIARHGWDLVYLPGLDLSLALPLADLERADSDGATVWRSRSGGLSLVAVTQSQAEAADWHRAALAAQAPQGSAQTLRRDDRMLTASTTADGWRIYQRSDRIGGGWSTLRLLAAPEQSGLIGLAAASIARGQPQRWDMPADGALARLVGAAFGLLDPLRPPAVPASLVAGPAEPAPQEDDTQVSTGSAFYLGPQLLVTAAHVAADCQSLALADGTPLSLVAVDAERDIAALRTPKPVKGWLGLAAPGGLRLGQRVHAVGYPYFGLSGTRLNVAGGNVSALAGMDDDPRFLSITAPVQPGNSGGPLLDAHGSVAGVVVARLSESYIEQTTGSLPQNVNYALTGAEIAGFLRESGLRASAHPLPGFDMDQGAPTDITSIVVPVVCY